MLYLLLPEMSSSEVKNKTLKIIPFKIFFLIWLGKRQEGRADQNDKSNSTILLLPQMADSAKSRNNTQITSEDIAYKKILWFDGSTKFLVFLNWNFSAPRQTLGQSSGNSLTNVCGYSLICLQPNSNCETWNEIGSLSLVKFLKDWKNCQV